MFAKQFHALKHEVFSSYVDIDKLKSTVSTFKADRGSAAVISHASEFEALLIEQLRGAESFFSREDHKLRKALLAKQRARKEAKKVDSERSEQAMEDLMKAAGDLQQTVHHLRVYCDMNLRALDYAERSFVNAAGLKGRFCDDDDDSEDGAEESETAELFPTLREAVATSSLQKASTSLVHVERDIASMLRQKPLKVKKSMPSGDSAPVHCTKLVLTDVPPGTRRRFWLQLASDSLGQPISVPVIVIRGAYNGPVVGVTAALHGNELNGVPVIHQIAGEVQESTMCGTLVCVVVANSPGFVLNRREFGDGVDLNRIMPGKANGNRSAQYASKFVKKILSQVDYLLDLHTASAGRRNALYVRADMNIPEVHTLAMLSEPQIIVHNTGPDGSLRGAAADLGIPAVTVEIADPGLFQQGYIHMAVAGVRNVLRFLSVLPIPKEALRESPAEVNQEEAQDRSENTSFTKMETVVCGKSYWMFTDEGGLLEVLVHVTDTVVKGEPIARIKNIFGDVSRVYHAPEDGIIVGRNANPAAQCGDRILHLGIPTRSFASVSNDGH